MKIKPIVWQERPSERYPKSKLWIGTVGQKTIFGATNSMQDGSGKWGLQFFVGTQPDEKVVWYSTVLEMKKAAAFILEAHVKELVE